MNIIIMKKTNEILIITNENLFRMNICLPQMSASFDNKDKFNVGTEKVFLRHDSPNYPDHDFPYRNSTLAPYGYELLLSKPRKLRSISPPRHQTQKTRSRYLSTFSGSLASAILPS